MPSTGSTGSSTLPKWQLAILLGTPIAIGIGYYLYRKQSTGYSDDEKTKKKTLKDKSISIDGNDSLETAEELERKRKQTELENEKLPPIKQAQLYKNDGNLCYRNGKFDEAIQFYDKAIEKCPSDCKTDLAIFYQNRAAAYEMLKKWSQVIADCTKSLEYNPRYSKAYFRRAKAYEQTNNLTECLDDITATCILEMFQNATTIMFADRVLKQTGQNDAIEGMKKRQPILPSKHFLKTYFNAFVHDPFKNRNNTIQSGIGDNTNEIRGYLKALKLYDEEKYEDIISACTEEIDTSESESLYKTEALLLRGTFHLLCGSYTEAQQDLDAVINNSEADTDLRVNALLKRASLHTQLELKELGFDDFEAAEKLNPKCADIYHQRAQIYILHDKLEEALKDFEKTVSLAPKHGMAYVQKCYTEYRLACISQDQMRLLAVMNEFKNSIEKYPDCVECYSLMAQVLSEQQQFDQADSFFEKALKMSPENASLYVHRGIMQLQWNGDIQKALDYMKKAIEIDEKCELAYETLGTIEVQRANLEKSIELFEKAIKLAKNPTEMSHLYALRNAAIAQINVTKKLGIDMQSISALAAANVMPPSTT